MRFARTSDLRNLDLFLDSDAPQLVDDVKGRSDILIVRSLHRSPITVHRRFVTAVAIGSSGHHR